ncbi:hybrid sensor histidine kinase/response regulator transcription factor [Arsenicibacter rosenii]|uniref:histidine kinase n=1 Tax=Arsenicibacter rosenii TaxID=1750698 RepID=A0A1S2VF74_9BACT|nr:two-component regulator propeller domain-containing protein [Arsenicibacter rosenii]OIN57374.1 hypothetical protein BLX24_20590 [Arsenicibacter rosenii]
MLNVSHNWIRLTSFWLVISLAGLAGRAGYAQKAAFEHLTAENGLSQNSVLSIAQDYRGFMWFGTRLGLNRFDGFAFKNYRTIPGDTTSLTGNYILCLLSDRHKKLWIGTQNGLNRYNPLTDSFTRIVARDQPGSLAGNVISCLSEDRSGRLWIGTTNGLHCLEDPEHMRFQVFTTASGLPDNNIRSIFQDHTGTIWIGTTKGLAQMTRTGGKITVRTFRHDNAVRESLADNYITAITGDNRHTLWIGTISGGLHRYNPDNQTFTRFTHSVSEPDGLVHNNIRQMLPDSRGRLWIGTQEGLSLFDPGKASFDNYQHDALNKKSLNKNSVYSIFEDNQGSVWVGTYYGGVNVSYAHHTDFTTIQNTSKPGALSDDVVSSFVEDRHTKGPVRNLWIGTEGGGLNYLDRQTGRFTAYKHNPSQPASLGSNLIKTVYQDRHGNVWAGTHGGGLNRLAPGAHTFEHFLLNQNDPQTPNAEVLSLLEDSQGLFLVGTNQGLLAFRQAVPPLLPVQLMPDQEQTIGRSSVKVLIESRNRTIWIGSSWGVFQIGPDRKTVQKIRGSVLEHVNVNALKEDRHGRLWIGTSHEGIFLYDPVRQTTKGYTTRDGLPNNDIAAIQEDNRGRIWISTGNGLSRFDPTHETFINYTTSDGLAGNDFNYNASLKTAAGELFFGGYQGITAFNPERLSIFRQASPVVITGLRLFNTPVLANDRHTLLDQDISLTRQLTFRHDQNVFTIDFALLNFIKPNKNKYAYKLDGFDNDWRQATIPSATYTNLPAGQYTFRVKGANNDGLWSAPIQLQIEVLPPFWKTWWAYLIYTLVIAGIIALIIRFFVLRALLKRDHELNQIKLNFFTNVSHEIRTHLTLIAGPIERIMLARKEDPLVQQQLGYVQHDADRLLKLVNELMDFRKAETNHLKLHITKFDLVPFLTDIYAFFREVSLSKNINTTFCCDHESIIVYADREQLEKVFFNLLSNAYKFTPDNGSIDLAIKAGHDRISVQITDNGRGIAPEFLDKLFDNFFQVDDHGIQNTGYGIGLALAKTIVELHSGQLSVESQLAADPHQNRTCFTVLLKTGMAHFSGQFPVQSDDRPSPDFALMQEHVVTNGLPDQPEAIDFEPLLPDTDSGPFPPKQYTILYIEDNPSVRAFVADALAPTYQVIQAGNGQRGWETAIELIPDLIISDVMMPEMDGFTLCNKLKADERTSHIPVILLTAKSAVANQVNGLAMGADVYLTKPFSLQVLGLHVRNLLATREKMRQRYSREITLQPQEIQVSTVDEQFLKKAMHAIEQNLDNPAFDVDMLANEVGMSRTVLYKKVKALTDMSVNDFVKSVRLQKATQLLRQKQLTIYEVAYAVGFSDRKYFSKEFKKQYGMTPSDYIHPEESST